jgi:hypothetical protein
MEVRIRLVSGDINDYIIAHQSGHVNRKCFLLVLYVWLQPRVRKNTAEGRSMKHRKTRMEHGGIQTRFKIGGQKIGLNIANFLCHSNGFINL